MNAGPWLPVPPRGYGGIENVVATLVPELRRLGVEVVLATVGTSTLPVDERVVGLPGRAVRAPAAAVQPGVRRRARRTSTACVRRLRGRDDIDLVHDHVEAVGLATLAALGAAAPPVLHTLHWDLGKHPELYGALRRRRPGVGQRRLRAQLARAPAGAARRTRSGTCTWPPRWPTDADRRPVPAKGDHVVVLGRITPGKGQDLGRPAGPPAGFDLVLAGPVGPYHRPADLDAGLATGTPRRTRTCASGASRSRRTSTATGCAGSARWPADERDELVGHRPGGAVPAALGGAGRHRGGRVAGAAARRWSAIAPRLPARARRPRPHRPAHRRRGRAGRRAGRRQLIDPAECAQEATRRFTPGVMAERYLDLYRTMLTHGMR